jgi:hypothetical protein
MISASAWENRSALGGTRTPNLLIRSYRRGPARRQRCSPARVLMPAQDGRSAHGLLYLAAVLGDSHHLIRRDIRMLSWPACRALTRQDVAQQCAAVVGLWRPCKSKIRPGHVRPAAGVVSSYRGSAHRGYAPGAAPPCKPRAAPAGAGCRLALGPPCERVGLHAVAAWRWRCHRPPGAPSARIGGPTVGLSY